MNVVQDKKPEKTKWDFIIYLLYFTILFTGTLGILEECGMYNMSLSFTFLLALPVAAMSFLLSYLTKGMSVKTKVAIVAVLFLLTFLVRLVIRYSYNA